MDELQRGSHREFIFINQATNKIRFNILESVAEDDQHGKNIVLLNRSLRRLSPEEFREAKHVLAKFFHTVQYILNTKGGFTSVEHKKLKDRLLGLSILMGYGIKRNAQLLDTIIH